MKSHAAGDLTRDCLVFLEDRQFSSFECFAFEFWVLRFRFLGASFSRFGCFVLRSSFSSASFSKLLVFYIISNYICQFFFPYNIKWIAPQRWFEQINNAGFHVAVFDSQIHLAKMTDLVTILLLLLCTTLRFYKQSILFFLEKKCVKQRNVPRAENVWLRFLIGCYLTTRHFTTSYLCIPIRGQFGQNNSVLRGASFFPFLEGPSPSHIPKFSLSFSF